MARLKAYWETEHAAAQKEREKRQQAVLNRWTKLVQGLRIRQRMREQYGGGTHGSGILGDGDVGSSPAVASGNSDDHDGRDDEGGVQPATVGGFITGVEDVVQRYSLPRPTHVVFSSPPRSPNLNGSPPPPATAGPIPGPGTFAPSSCFPAAANDDDDKAGEEHRQQVQPTFPEDLEVEMDNMSGLELESTQRVRRMPKSMAALAAEAEAQAQATTDVDAALTPLHICEEGQEAASSKASRSLRSATRATPRTKPKTKTETKSTVTATATAGTPSRSNRSRSRKRARTQDDDDNDDDDDEVAACGGSGLGSESGSDGGEDMNGGGRPRVAKRARKHRRGSSADGNANGALLAPVPPSDRVLRTRKGKSSALLAQGLEQELAVERALAG